MKPVICLLLSFICIAHSDLPAKRNMRELKVLWDKSPFTTKPVVEEDTKDQLEDWSLAGVSSNPNGGYSVTIFNKKDRENRIRLNSDGKYAENNASDFRILEVVQKGFDYKETTVKLAVGKQKGWVGYDESLIAIKAPPKKKTTSRTTKGNKKTTTRKRSTKTPGTRSSSSRRPRIRRVAPAPNR